MAKQIRKKTRAQLGSPDFQRRASTQKEVLLRSLAECEKLTHERHEFVRGIADGDWLDGFSSGESFVEKVRNWYDSVRQSKIRKRFLVSPAEPNEIHCFACIYDVSRGFEPLIRSMNNSGCDAGTALRVYWTSDPVYYSQYDRIGDSSDNEEKDAMRLLETIKLRFASNNFATRKVYFDPAPWVSLDDVVLKKLDLPHSMLSALPDQHGG